MNKCCQYCSEPDSHGVCAGIRYTFPDFDISADYSQGKLVIFTAAGDECEINFAYCPICGKKMEVVHENS